MKIILSVIAICLVMITVKLYTPNAIAHDNQHTHVFWDIPDIQAGIKAVVRTYCTTDGEYIKCTD
tara:strand:+ start:211 stop:405 length:195 start_codon:yes stop_codon:yes gene_type:complete